MRGKPARRVPRKQTVFLIGHRGTIGRDVAHLFQHCDVTTYDKQDAQDTRSIEMLREIMPKNVNLIVHLANIPHPGWGDWDIYYQNNVRGTENIIQVAKEKMADQILFFSSLAAIGFDAPWGNPPGAFWHVADKVLAEGMEHEWPKGEPPWDEDTEPLPIPGEGEVVIEPYGVSKSWQEKLLIESGIPTMILRLGPYCFDDSVYETRSVDCYADAVSRVYTDKAIRGMFHLGFKAGIFHVCRPGMWGGHKLKGWLDGK